MLDVVQPGTGQVIERLLLESRDQALAKIQTAWDAHQRRAAQPLHERLAILNRTAALLETRRDSLAILIATEGGKPLRDAQVEVQRLAAGEPVELHRLMLRLEESRMSFQLMMQVRNRLLEAYQDVMRMQV